MIPTSGSMILFAAFAGIALAQPEVMAWGNLTGLRVEGHLLELSTSMCVAQPELAGVSCTGREKQQNNYSRNGKTETVTVRMRAPREFRDPQGGGWTMNATEIQNVHTISGVISTPHASCGASSYIRSVESALSAGQTGLCLLPHRGHACSVPERSACNDHE